MKGITKYIFDSYGVAIRNTTVKILDKVDFDLRKGEVHILVGENGAGKSTLMKVLGGIIPPDEGEILLDGERVHPRNAREALALGIGFIHQELNLCGNLTVTDNIFMSREIVRRGVKDKKAMCAEAKRLLEETGIHIDPNVLVACAKKAYWPSLRGGRALPHTTSSVSIFRMVTGRLGSCRRKRSRCTNPRASCSKSTLIEVNR